MPPSGAPERAIHRPLPLAVEGLVVERREGRQLRKILDSIDLVVEPGAVVAVTGPSGAGKTTLLHAVAGLLRPSRGSVSWGGLKVSALPEAARDRWRRDTVGLVFQDFQLLAEIGVLANILLPTHFDRWRISRAMIERADRLAARVGLDRRMLRAGRLSRGEQQRLAIARALMREPELLLADEPTASLDAASSTRVIDLLVDGAREGQASLVMVSHDPDLLSRADRVYRLEVGALRVERDAAP